MNSLSLRSSRRTITIAGKEYTLDFDMLTLSHAEMVYDKEYGKKGANVQQIFADLFEQSTTAVMALGYAALTSAGTKISWEKFAKDLFTWDSVEDWNTAVCEGIADMLPDADPAAVEDTTEKN